jgi:hypothetical protein
MFILSRLSWFDLLSILGLRPVVSSAGNLDGQIRIPFQTRRSRRKPTRVTTNRCGRTFPFKISFLGTQGVDAAGRFAATYFNLKNDLQNDSRQ